MIPLIAAALYGMAGYQNNKNRERDNARQDKRDAQDAQLFDLKMEEVAREKKLNSDVAAAAKPATFSESAPTLDTGDGAKVYGMENGADIAASDARQFQRMAPAAAAPVQGQAFAVNGAAVADKTAMQAAVKAYDEGANDRVAQAYRSNGKPLEALSMSNAVMENKAKSMGLETAELKHLNTLYNNKVISRLKAPGGTMFENAAQIVSDVQFGGLEGSTGRVELSPDGKTVNLIATKDGKDSPPLSFQNNAAGQAQLMQRFMKADDATQLAFLKDAADREAAQGKAALDERRVAAIERRADTDSRKIDGMMAGLIGGRRGDGQGNSSGVPMQDIYKRLEADFSVKDPETNKITKDIGAISIVRNLVLQMPAAKAGDADGAYLQAMQVYQKAQAIGKGDPGKTKQALAQILGGGEQDAYPRATSSELEQIRKLHGGSGKPPGRPAPPPETAIPMSYIHQAKGDPVLARKIMDDELMAGLNAAAPKTSMTSVLNKYPLQR